MFNIKEIEKDAKNLDQRAFLKKYAKRLKGPQKVPFIIFYIVISSGKKIITSRDIKNYWERNISILGQYNHAYITRAREYGYIKRKNKSKYENIANWIEKINNFGKNLKEILSARLLKRIKNKDKKIYILGKELNLCWQNECWNACGILMRIILERILDYKHENIKSQTGLKNKINYALSSDLFGKSMKEVIKNLSHTKIIGDIVAHNSKIILDKDDIESGAKYLKILIKEVLNL